MTLDDLKLRVQNLRDSLAPELGLGSRFPVLRNLLGGLQAPHTRFTPEEEAMIEEAFEPEAWGEVPSKGPAANPTPRPETGPGRPRMAGLLLGRVEEWAAEAPFLRIARTRAREAGVSASEEPPAPPLPPEEVVRLARKARREREQQEIGDLAVVA